MGKIKSNSKYTISLANKQVSFIDSTFYDIKVISDNHPIITINNTETNKFTEPIISGLIRDDYGFFNLEFFSIIKGENKDTLIQKEIEISSKIMNKEARICGICLGKLSIFNVYVPNGNPTEITEKYEFKLQWLDELSKMVELYISNYQDIIVAGDFNVLEHKNDVKDFENWNLSKDWSWENIKTTYDQLEFAVNNNDLKNTFEIELNKKSIKIPVRVDKFCFF